MNQSVQKIKTKTPPIRVCGHYVLVKPEAVEKVSAGGIITGTEHQHSREHVASVRGVIVGIGPNAWKAFNQGEPSGVGKPWAEEGANVYFKRHVSDRIEDVNDIVDGKPQEYFLMVDENVLAVIEE